MVIVPFGGELGEEQAGLCPSLRRYRKGKKSELSRVPACDAANVPGYCNG
jgi:hypothetical protein